MIVNWLEFYEWSFVNNFSSIREVFGWIWVWLCVFILKWIS